MHISKRGESLTLLLWVVVVRGTVGSQVWRASLSFQNIRQPPVGKRIWTNNIQVAGVLGIYHAPFDNLTIMLIALYMWQEEGLIIGTDIIILVLYLYFIVKLGKRYMT